MQSKIIKLHKLLKERKISEYEIISSYSNNINELNPIINAYITTFEDSSHIKKTDDFAENMPILSGIPVSIKDNICTKGSKTTCASKMLESYECIFDAFAVEKIKEQNAFITGKTNMDEFAMGSTGENSFYGPTLNPYNLSCVSGGSSGGAAASVASDMAVFALGSDTGGSVRLPASYCGCVGLKPTYGSISRYGLIAYASQFDQIGIIASSVEDTAIAFDAINIYDNRDSTCLKTKRNKTFPIKSADIKNLKIGIYKDFEADDCVKNAVYDALKFFEKSGALITEIDIPLFNLVTPAYYVIASAQAASNLSRYDGIRYGFKSENYISVNEMIEKTRTEGFGEEVKKRILLGNYVLSSDRFNDYYVKAQKIRDIIYNQYKKIYENVDIIICPTSYTTAPKLSEFKDNSVNMYANDIYNVSANLCGFPSLTVPCGIYDGMPIGMQLMGDKFSESLLLNTAFVYENERGEFPKPKIGGNSLEL